MPFEIEHKFLVKSDAWRSGSDRGTLIRQGYLSHDPDRTVRVRVAGSEAFLTIKGRAAGTRRLEFEYPIPVADATELLALCRGSLIEKTRFVVAHAGHTWEIDVFEGDNAGLLVAEIELENEGETFELPAWAGEEVSHDRRYSNASLAEQPFCTWKTENA